MVKYTKEDMKKLHELSTDGSPAKVYTEETNFSPIAFRKVLESYGCRKDVHYLFELPFDEVPLLINRGELSGYLKFRFMVGK